MQNHRPNCIRYLADSIGTRGSEVGRAVLTLAFVTISYGPLPNVFGQSAEEQTAPPKTQLFFGMITIDGADQVELDYSLFSVDKVEQSQAVKVPITVTKVVDGREATVTEYRTEIRTRLVEKVTARLVRRSESLERIKLFRISGKALNADDINAMRERKTVAILLQNDQSIEPYYQSILRPDAIVVRLPTLQRTR